MDTKIEPLEIRQLMSVAVEGATSLQIGNTLYISDLVNGQGQLFKSNPDGGNKTLLQSWAGVQPDQFFDFNGKLLFDAPQSTSVDGARQLWISDGTVGGTALLLETTNQTSFDPSGFVLLNGRVIFLAAEGLTPQLWSTDGTTGGTIELFSNDFGGVTELSIRDNLLYFIQNGLSGK